MKIDIVRAWKDESYRQSLSAEELNMLPANPVGELELTEAEMQEVSGGHSPDHVAVAQDHINVESWALICELNVFSLNLVDLKATLVNILSPTTSVCINAH